MTAITEQQMTTTRRRGPDPICHAVFERWRDALVSDVGGGSDESPGRP